jgi:hypothetical protein
MGGRRGDVVHIVVVLSNDVFSFNCQLPVGGVVIFVDFPASKREREGTETKVELTFSGGSCGSQGCLWGGPPARYAQ